ncbi:YbaK/EbsC family protein [Snodgrassella sp. CFCC 13594]|uniref:YbaK/EbsC family protein n=1 Tax=Snodgrassella sp. CFCC 13594 TaxID=1775559 RepID=UPI00083597CC|nr:YbaK/EbsC family protein [Snodgrassella sp. CFCC 13594]
MHTTTDPELSAGTQKVLAQLQRSGLPFTLKILHDSTRTAQMAADVLGCQPAEIASSLIFENTDNGQFVLIVASGGQRVDVHYVSTQLNQPLRMARGRDIKKHTGFAIGGVPPLAHHHPLPTYLDASLQSFDTIWAAAGSPFAVFGIHPANLAILTGGQWLPMRPISQSECHEVNE